MPGIKPFIKQLFYTTRTTRLLDRLMYFYARISNAKKNSAYKKQNPNIVLPPDYFLYETFRLDYQNFIEDGAVTAGELIELAGKYLPAHPGKILEWGCGVGRVIRHMSKYTGEQTGLFGCDINAEMIDWAKRHFPEINFSVIDRPLTTQYPGNSFNFIYAISVFTHIRKEDQHGWLLEMHRILATEGIFIFTTHGRRYFDQLLPSEKRCLFTNGIYTKSIRKAGHRLMTTYHVPAAFRAIINTNFEILEFYEGETHPSKAGGQDLWIARKKHT